eukprot:CAMPEP_0170063944 /NCGR_PEP_ID=MMETSP0019_2-20121128/4622_1 /TAXON_ID=98059 /ORGANISM="Dinobryon sp., Strain UTEXLB2267" /LENGTH=31 /DNA_ID= /DNA_START= /DNA_END= /DNA_ORIENTATION=
MNQTLMDDLDKTDYAALQFGGDDVEGEEEID